jgi:hypothetical protein
MQAATSTAPGGAHHHAAAVARHRSASIRTSSGAVEGRYGIGRHIAQRLVFGVWVAVTVAVEGCEVTGAGRAGARRGSRNKVLPTQRTDVPAAGRGERCSDPREIAEYVSCSCDCRACVRCRYVRSPETSSVANAMDGVRGRELNVDQPLGVDIYPRTGFVALTPGSARPNWWPCPVRTVRVVIVVARVGWCFARPGEVRLMALPAWGSGGTLSSFYVPGMERSPSSLYPGVGGHGRLPGGAYEGADHHTLHHPSLLNAPHR